MLLSENHPLLFVRGLCSLAFRTSAMQGFLKSLVRGEGQVSGGGGGLARVLHEACSDQSFSGVVSTAPREEMRRTGCPSDTWAVCWPSAVGPQRTLRAHRKQWHRRLAYVVLCDASFMAFPAACNAALGSRGVWYYLTAGSSFFNSFPLPLPLPLDRFVMHSSLPRRQSLWFFFPTMAPA